MIVFALHAGAGTFKENVETICANSIRINYEAGTYDGNSNLMKGKRKDYLVHAIMELEKSPNLNCGIGSNLTESGVVECEAAFICSNNLAFGAVAKCQNCVCPILAARKLAEPYEINAVQVGLIQPMILVGTGADKYCKTIDYGITENEKLKTNASKENFIRAKKMLTLGCTEYIMSCDKADLRLDTVGGVLIDLSDGYSEACVSSGGIILKKEGRIGHSAHFGAAIWAERKENISIAISLSGCGEAIIRTQLAEKLAEQAFIWDFESPFVLQQITTFLEENFLNSKRLIIIPKDKLLLGGLLLIKQNNFSILIVFHNSRHFPFAFITSNGKKRRFKSTNEKIGEFICNFFPL